MTQRTATKHVGIQSYETREGRRYRVIAPGVVDPATGARGKQRTKAGFETIAEAKKARAEMVAGTGVSPASSWTVRQLYERWLAELVESGQVIASSLGLYEQVMSFYWLPVLGTRKLSQVTTLDLQDMIRAMHKAGAKPTTLSNRWQPVRSMFRRALDWGLVTRNPASGVKLPTAGETPGRALSLDEVRRLLAECGWVGRGVESHHAWTRHSGRDPGPRSCPNSAEQAGSGFITGPLGESPSTSFGTHPEGSIAAGQGLFVEVLVTTGLRVGELIVLRWSDLDLDAGVLSVRRTMSKNRAGGDLIREGAKTRAGVREVLLLSGTVAGLRCQRSRVEAARAADPWWQDEDFVFASKHGKAFHVNTPSLWLRARLAAAGIPPTRVHDLRHTHTTMLRALGINQAVVEARLGHKGAGISARYTHLDVGAQAAAVEALQRALNGTDEGRSARRRRPGPRGPRKPVQRGKRKAAG